jgi:ribosome maturation factor RimP
MEDGTRQETIERVRRLAESLAEVRGLSVLEVEYRPGGQLLRVFLDRRHGQVGIDDCSAVSQQLSAALDQQDLIPHAYRLEVSSPGPERPLRGEEDYARFRGERARMSLAQPNGGSTVLRGAIGEVQSGMLRLEPEGQEPLWVPLSQILSARLDPAAPRPPLPGKTRKKTR